MSLDKAAGNVGERNPVSTPVNRKKLAPHFVDEISNISIAPSGACRIYFNTWSTDDSGKALRVESELIMTMQSLTSLAEALPQAIEQTREAQKLGESSET